MSGPMLMGDRAHQRRVVGMRHDRDPPKNAVNAGEARGLRGDTDGLAGDYEAAERDLVGVLGT